MTEPEPRNSHVDRIVREAIERLRAGQPTELEDYLLRYPHFEEDLRNSITYAVKADHDTPLANSDATNPASTDPSSVREQQAQFTVPNDFAGEPIRPGLSPEASGHEKDSTLRATQLGDFRLLREVGRGGMGVVYEAEQVSLGRHVALKVLPPNMIRDTRFRRRFEREARAAGRLHHTNIVPVFGVGEHEGTPFYVMQFISGLGLDKVLTEIKRLKSSSAPGVNPGATAQEPPDKAARGLAASLLTNAFDESSADEKRKAAIDAAETVASNEEPVTRLEKTPNLTAAGFQSKSAIFGLSSPSQQLVSSGVGIISRGTRARKPTYWHAVARLGAQVASALDHAHRLGILHRDIKPSNLLLDTQGTVWMTDFGLAKADDLENLTDTGDVLGTLRYMPPEAFQGIFDARSDVYSLGLTLYELVSLRPAFGERNKAQLIRQVSNDPIARLSSLVPDVPRDLDTIIHKSIERERDHRYTSASELCDDLNRYLDDEPIRARRLSKIEQLQRWSSRNKLVASLLGLIASILTIGMVATAIFAAHFFSLASREMQARREADNRLADNYTFSGLVAGDQGNEAQAGLWFANAAFQARSDQDRRVANELRFDLWRRRAPQPVFGIHLENRVILNVRFHPSGRYLMVNSDIGCQVFDLETQQQVQLPDSIAKGPASTWSPAGDWIAGGNDHQLALFRVPSLEPGPKLSGPKPLVALQFSRDGTRLAVAFDNQTLLWNWRDETSPVMLPPFPSRVAQVEFSPSGESLAVRCGDNQGWVYQLLPGTQEASLAMGPFASGKGWEDSPGGLLFVKGDNELVTISGPNEWTWWDLEHQRILMKVPTRARVHRIKGSPDDQTFTVCLNPDAEIWDIATARCLEPKIKHRNYVYDVAYRPDCRAILTVNADLVARLWNISTGTPLSPPIQHQDEIRLADFAKDGTRFATAQKDGLVRVWQLGEDPNNVTKIPLGIDESFAVLSSDGKFLIPAGWNDRREQRSTRVYETATGRPVGEPMNAPGLINGAAFAPNGRDVLLLSSSPEFIEQHNRSEMGLGSQPGFILFFDSRTGEKLAQAIPTVSEPIGAAFHPKNGDRAVVVCAGGQVMLIEPKTARVIRTESIGHSAFMGFLYRDWVRFAPDGKTYATWGLGSRVDLWDAKTGGPLQSIGLSERAHNAFFSHDGRLLFTMSSDKYVEIWTTKNGASWGDPLEHDGWVFNACLSPDGKSVLTACRDRSAGLWDWQAGKRIVPALHHEHEVLDVAFSHDGHWIFTACKDGNVRAWDAKSGLAVGPLMKVACPIDASAAASPGAEWYPEQLAVTRDGETLVVAGIVGDISLLSLSIFNHREVHHLDAMLSLAELASGQTLHEGGGLVNLTSAQWITRWNQHRANYPQAPKAEESSAIAKLRD